MERLKAILLVILVTASVPLTAEVYKVVDEKTGHVTFTDKPSPNKKQETVKSVDLPPVNTQPAIEIETTPKTIASPADEQLFVGQYESFSVSQPKDQSTIPPGQLNLIIQLKSKPQLQNGHKIQLYFDNQKYGQPASASSFNIDKLFRGAHNISASIVDETGKTLISTQTITVFVKRGSKLN